MSEPVFLPPSRASDWVQPAPAPAWAGGVRHLPVVISFGAPDPEAPELSEAAAPALAAEVRPGWILARNEDSWVEVVSLDAYPEGIELWIRGTSTRERLQLRRGVDLDPFGRHWPLAGQSRARIPDTLLRVGVHYADGRRVTNISGWDSPMGGPSLSPLGGGGSRGRHHQGYWIAPLPESGGLTLLCEWPAAGIALTGAEIGAEEIQAAVDRSG